MTDTLTVGVADEMEVAVETPFIVAVNGKEIPDAGALGFKGLLKVARDIFYDGRPDPQDGVLNVQIAVRLHSNGIIEATGLNVVSVEYGNTLWIEPPVEY